LRKEVKDLLFSLAVGTFVGGVFAVARVLTRLAAGKGKTVGEPAGDPLEAHGAARSAASRE
jgi:hypothetical protein